MHWQQIHVFFVWISVLRGIIEQFRFCLSSSSQIQYFLFSLKFSICECTENKRTTTISAENKYRKKFSIDNYEHTSRSRSCFELYINRFYTHNFSVRSKFCVSYESFGRRKSTGGDGCFMRVCLHEQRNWQHVEKNENTLLYIAVAVFLLLLVLLVLYSSTSSYFSLFHSICYFCWFFPLRPAFLLVRFYFLYSLFLHLL